MTEDVVTAEELASGRPSERRFHPFAEYRDSGIEWLGKLPAHWRTDRLKWTVTMCRNGIWGSEPDGVDDIACVRVADFDRQRFLVQMDEPTFRAITPSQREGRCLRHGDLLLEKSGGGALQPVGAVMLYDHDQTAVCSNFVARMPISAAFLGRFLSYFHAHLYSGRVNTRSIKQTTGIQNLDSDAYLAEKVPYVPLDEQRAIAAFLDRETARIDELIARKQRLLELLAEKRTALISHAVTKGLNPDVPMKDSGVEWLGRVPRHWKVGVLKHRLRGIEQGWSPQCEGRRPDPGEWGVLKVGCMNTGVYDEGECKALPSDLVPIPEYEVAVGDLLMSRSNTAQLVGSVGRVNATQGRIMLCDKLYRIAIDHTKLNPEYAVHLLRSRSTRHQFERDATGASASMKNISNDRVENLILAFPDLTEQAAILQYLAEHLSRYSDLMSRVATGVEHVNEYRSALISAAVTGKIDVRNEVQV